jgi:uncharacterized membrane protein
MPEEDRLSAIAKTLDQVIRWQAELDARIRELEKGRALAAVPPATSAPPAFPAAAPPPVYPVAHPVAAVPPPIPFPRQHPPQQPLLQQPLLQQPLLQQPLLQQPLLQGPIIAPAPFALPRPQLETTLGLNWINRIAVVTLLFGAAFLFKYGVDNNWIGLGARVALGVVAGLGAIVAGHFLTKRNQPVFAQGITGLGLALLYLSFYAAAGLYHVMDPVAAFFLMVATTIGAGALALKDNAQAIAVLGMIGGYLAPLALYANEDRPWSLFTYLFLLNLGGLVLARLRPWRVIEPLAFWVTVTIYSIWANEYWRAANRPVATVFALAFYAQFAAAQMRLLWWLAQFLAPLTLAAIWESPPQFLPFELLLAASGLVVSEWRKWREGPSWSLFCFWLPMWAWIGIGSYTSADPGSASLYIAFAFVLFLAWTVGWILIGKRPAHPGNLIVLAANPAAYFGVSYLLLNPAHHQWMGLFAALLGGIHLFVAGILWKDAPTEQQETFRALMAAGVALAFVTLAIPIQFVGFSVTIAWALEGMAVVWVWSRFHTLGSGIGGGVILTLAVLRLLSQDAMLYQNGGQFQALVNARFLTFLVVAICLWLAAWFVRSGPGAAIPYIAGHVIMLFILALEIVGAAERSWPAADQASLVTVGISILMAFYAVLLITAGVAVHVAIHRILGLILAGIVILKLYMVDVWVLGLGFRIAAFIGLGVLLLAVSYLYSHFRPSVQKLWKD